MFLKNRNIISKMKRSKVTDYAALNKAYQYHKLRETFSKFYRKYNDLISKFQLSEPEFYCDLVYKLKKIVGSNNFSAQFIK